MIGAAARERSGFTLIEVLAALTIAMVLAGLCTSALIQIRTMVRRAQLRIAIHQRSEAIYVHLSNLFGAQLNSGPLVLDMVGGTSPRLRLLAMTSKLDNWDWKWPTNQTGVDLNSSDIGWQLLDWNGAENRLYAAASQPWRSFVQYNTSLRNPAQPNIDFLNGNRTFYNQPQPRRTLEYPVGTAAASWADATRALDGNMLFPDLTSVPSYPDVPFKTLAGTNRDVGDWGDLLSQRLPIADGVTDFRLAVVPVDGGSPLQTFDRSTSKFRNYAGVWLDGDLGTTHGTPTGTAAVALAGPIGQRPRMLRVRMTLEERLRPYDPNVVDSDETRIQVTFTYAFLLPGHAGPPTSP